MKNLITLLLVIGIVASISFIAATSLDIISISSDQDIIEYNNGLTDERNQIVLEVENITKAVNETKSPDEIKSQIESLDDAINTFSQSLNEQKSPKGAEELKVELELYAIYASDFSKKATEYANNLETEEVEIKTLIEEYNASQEKLNLQNFKIAEKLNKLVGYDAGILPESYPITK